VHLECLDVLILSVIDFKHILSDRMYKEYSKNAELLVFQGLMKRLILASLSQGNRMSHAIKQIPQWVKKHSSIISPKLKEILGVLEQSYMATLISKLDEIQCDVIAACGSLLIVNTEKQDAEGCKMYIDYINGKLSAFPGFELMKIRAIRIYRKLILVNNHTYYYKEDDDVRCFSEVLLPRKCLDLYFDNEELCNDQIYESVATMEAGSVKMLLEILSYRMNVCGLASNCYRLAGIKNFESESKYEPRCFLFCRLCGHENRAGKRCLKCFSLIDRESIGSSCLEYLYELTKCQLAAVRCCVHCKSVAERKLREYCRCGGKLVVQDFISEMRSLGAFVNTVAFDEELSKIVGCFRK